MSITKVYLERFTAFDDLDVEVSPGINVLVGANGTGKTHFMKVCYAACAITKTDISFAEKLVRIFLPSGNALGRLVQRRGASTTGKVKISSDEASLAASFSNHSKSPTSARVSIQDRGWSISPTESVYIPVKEMLSNAPGFLSLHATRAIHFEEIYADVLHRAYFPLLRGPMDKPRRRLLAILENAIDGKVRVQNEEFFLRNKQGNLEFSLLAEGMRKLGLLWLLIQNGTLLSGSVLFWDEPETNLNPKLYGPLMEVLLELQRLGVQIFLATHDYVILRELDLQAREDDKIAFHSLYRTEEGKIACHTSNSYFHVHPNAIAEAFDTIYDREVRRSLTGILRQ